MHIDVLFRWCAKNLLIISDIHANLPVFQAVLKEGVQLYMSELLKNISDDIEFFLNILELIALIASVTTFFVLMLNKFSKALKEVLSPLGLGFVPRLRILFMCRKSALMKRAFIEYAILQTQGNAIIPSEWHALINGFKGYYSSADGDLIYTIPNCTLLISENFSKTVQRYFSYFDTLKVRKAFGVKDSCLKWATTIHIEEAYTTPTCLLTGLLSTYEENWSEFIARYVSSAYISESTEDEQTAVLTNELYLTFAWLLWGPSFELNYQNYWMGLCQISYGDESNSLPAIANKNSNIANMLAQKFIENKERRYGALMSLDISLYKNKEYFDELQGLVNPQNQYYYEKAENGVFSFAAQIDKFVPYESYKSKKYYCTAYVWLLFELEVDDYRFHPEHSVAFFEHANLADHETYSFLIDTLIEKSIKHFSNLFGQKQYSERKYRFVCAMNEEIKNAFVDRYSKIFEKDDAMGKKFKSNIIITPKREPDEAFKAFDEYFVQQSKYVFVDVSLKDKSTLSDLSRFYTEVYIDCFPDENERETFDNLLYYLKENELHKEYRYHIILIKDENNNILGGGIFDYFKETNCGMIEFVAVKYDSQSNGIGTLIYNHILAILSEDSFTERKEKLKYIFCEIDSPDYSKASIKKYLYFWNKHKYKHIDFNYIQPSLSPNQKEVLGLWLAVASISDLNKEVPSELVLKTIENYMKYSMQIENPHLNASYTKMKNELQKKENVSLLNIL